MRVAPVLLLWFLCLYAALPGRAMAEGLGLEPLADDAPDFSLRAAEGGESLTRASLAGRVALVYFWASWCVPCREELPQLDGLAGSLDPAHFVVLPVSVDTNAAPAEVASYARGAGLRLPVYVAADSGMPERLWGWGLPVSYLVDSHGAFVGRMLGPRNWRDPNVISAIAQLGRR